MLVTLLGNEFHNEAVLGTKNARKSLYAQNVEDKH